MSLISTGSISLDSTFKRRIRTAARFLHVDVNLGTVNRIYSTDPHCCLLGQLNPNFFTCCFCVLLSSLFVCRCCDSGCGAGTSGRAPAHSGGQLAPLSVADPDPADLNSSSQLQDTAVSGWSLNTFISGPVLMIRDPGDPAFLTP
jgi:hypothetical protein